VPLHPSERSPEDLAHLARLQMAELLPHDLTLLLLVRSVEEHHMQVRAHRFMNFCTRIP
jgi:hypothetical protein